MSIKADTHMHSHHSGDSESSMESMIESAIAAGLDTICFTEHNDFDFPVYPDLPAGTFELNADSYLYELLSMRDRYEDKIKILFGIEIGMQPNLMRENAILAKAHEYDFIIGSTHLAGGKDPYMPEYFKELGKKEGLKLYFEEELLNLKKHSNYDSCGHLDYAVRYTENPAEGFSYADYAEVIDDILDTLIDKEKALELNTASFYHGMNEPNPATAILKRYHEKGGELITIGSDAHTPDRIGYDFERAAGILKDIGYSYYAVYEKRSPEMRKL